MKSISLQRKADLSNLIVHDIRNLFPSEKKLPRPEDLIDKIQIEQYLEKTEDVYRLNLISADSAIEDVSYILKIDEPNLRGIAWSCLGGIHTFNGNYQKAFAAFNMALEQPIASDVKAYIFTEISNLLRKLGYVKESLSVLEASLTMTENERLIWRIKSYLGLCSKYENPKYSLAVLKESAEYYRLKKDYVRFTNVLRHIGSVYIYYNDYDAARKYFDMAMDISTSHSLQQYQYDILNDIGWLYIKKGEYKKAKEIFIELTQKDLSPYSLSLALQNLGYLEYERYNYREAISYHSQSLHITTQYEMRDMAFEDYYKLGLCYEKTGEIALSNHFYSQGYNEVLKEIDLGLRLMGYRKKLLDSYVRFLQRYQKIPSVDLKDEIFGFTMNKSLKEIREIFHTKLFNHHLKQTKTAPELCAKLGIDKRTYFLYQKKLGLKRGNVSSSPINPYLREYLESLTTHSWKEANQRFEKDLFSFLLSKYQYNKKKLAEVLNVSYGLVIQKTK